MQGSEYFSLGNENSLTKNFQVVRLTYTTDCGVFKNNTN